MSSKARSLRERMSIDPDAPTPVTERRPRSRATEPAAERDEERPRPATASDAAEPAVEPTVESAAPAAPVVRPVPAAAPVEEPTQAASDPAPTPDAERTAPAPSPREAPASSKRTSSRAKPGRAASRRTRRSGKDGVDWETALDDPAISAGGNGYRSFYVSDEVFARFRAAVYWTARRPDVDDVPDNMSVGIEDYMDSVATDLERRFNDKAVFPPTPDQVRAHRKRQNPS